MKARRMCASQHDCERVGDGAGTRAVSWVRAALFPIIGLASLIWFLVRVVPKPSRAGYPCQRVAAPLAGAAIVWLARRLSVDPDAHTAPDDLAGPPLGPS